MNNDFPKIHNEQSKTHFPGMDEIVFESRNKKYGAYLLRKAYKPAMTRAVIIAVSLFIIASLAAYSVYNVDLHPTNNFTVTYETFNYSPSEELQPPPPQEKPPEKEEIAQTEDKILTPVPADSLHQKSKQEEPEKSDKTDTNLIAKTENKTNNTDGEHGGSNYDGLMTALQALPSFPGGDLARLNFLRYNISYPEEEKKKAIQGVVIVTFTVEKDGSLSNIKISKGVSPAIDEEALRVVKLMPRWYPGIQHGKPVNVTV